MDEFIVISILWLGLGLGSVGFRNVVLNTLYRSTCILGLAPEKLFTLFHNFPFKQYWQLIENGDEMKHVSYSSG